MIESDSKRPVLRETRTEPRGAVWFLSIKAAGRDGALAQVNLENTLGPYRQCSGARVGQVTWMKLAGRSIADTVCSSKPLRGPPTYGY
jgi:hypothetical protein